MAAEPLRVRLPFIYHPGMYYCPGLIHLLSVLRGDALRRHLQTKHERYNYIVKYGQRKKQAKFHKESACRE